MYIYREIEVEENRFIQENHERLATAGMLSNSKSCSPSFHQRSATQSRGTGRKVVTIGNTL